MSCLSLAPRALHAAVIASPSEVVRVAWDQVDRNDTGSDFTAGGFNNAPIAARERQNGGVQAHLQGVTYLRFDLSTIAPSSVGDPGFAASFALDYTYQLNTTHSLAIGMDAVASANTWSDSVGVYPLATWVAPEVIGGTLPYEYLILNDVRTTSPPRSITLDVTSTVSDWLTGASNNNGFVIFGTTDVYQGAGFDNATLTLTGVTAVPEPSTSALLLAALATACICIRRCRVNLLHHPKTLVIRGF